MKRLTATVCTVCLFLAGLALSLWGRSLFRHDRVIWQVNKYCNDAVGSRGGQLYYLQQIGPMAVEEQAGAPRLRSEASDSTVGLTAIFRPPIERFILTWQDIDPDAPPKYASSNGRLDAFAWWVLALPLFLPSFIRFQISLFGFLRRARRRRGCLCAACGYDLRQTIERCPECGKRPADVDSWRPWRALVNGTALVAAVAVGCNVALLVAQTWAKPVASPAELARREQATREKAQADRAQAECWVYRASPQQVVYEDGSSPSANALLRTPGAARFKGNDMSGVGIVPECWKALSAIAGFGTAQSTLFLHERRTPNGTPVLLVIEYPVTKREAQGMAGGGTTSDFNFVAAISKQQTSAGPLERFAFNNFLVNASPDVAGNAVRFFAGQPDDHDATHFTIGYELKGARGTIDGWLLDAPFDTVVQVIGSDIVRMEIRNGPAKEKGPWAQ